MRSPISFKFVAASFGQQLKGVLYRFKPARTGEAPNWDGHGGPLTARDVPSPITDKSFWLERYVLCVLTLRTRDGQTLVINDAVCAISRAKNIVSTQLVGMDGTIKEYINDGDYQLNIAVGVVAVRDGVIVDEYPKEGISELRTFLDEKESIDVYSDFLDIFDINSIVIKSYSITQDTASNYQSVAISAVSDNEYNVYSTEY